MAKEIERKFLVTSTDYRNMAQSRHVIRQAYLSTSPDCTVRLRTLDNSAFITVKSRNHGASRHEWEYRIPIDDALEMMHCCVISPVIEKTRFRVGRWEVDEFYGRLQGLTVAEIELDDENEPIEFPPFIGREVTGDTRYYNSSLALAGEVPE